MMVRSVGYEGHPNEASEQPPFDQKQPMRTDRHRIYVWSANCTADAGIVNRLCCFTSRQVSCHAQSTGLTYELGGSYAMVWTKNSGMEARVPRPERSTRALIWGTPRVIVIGAGLSGPFLLFYLVRCRWGDSSTTRHHQEKRTVMGTMDVFARVEPEVRLYSRHLPVGC